MKKLLARQAKQFNNNILLVTGLTLILVGIIIVAEIQDIKDLNTFARYGAEFFVAVTSLYWGIKLMTKSLKETYKKQ